MAETASNDDARDDDDDDDDDNACSLSVLELSLFCEEQTTEAAADDAMPDYVEDHESLARPKASYHASDAIGTTEGALVQEQRAKCRAALSD